MSGLLALLLHAALILAAAPVLAGLMGWARARLRGRSAAVGQSWRDLRRLLRKQPVLPEAASAVFALAPAATLAVTLAAGLLVPSFALGMATVPLADLVVVAGLLLASRVPLVLAGLEAGTGLAGLGAGRAMLLRLGTEPVLLAGVAVLALQSGTTSLDGIAGAGKWAPRWPAALACGAIGLAGLVESGLGPARDAWPGTAARAYSGWHLAALTYAGQVRLVVWLSLLAAVALPAGPLPASAGLAAWAAGLAGWGAKLGAMALALLAVEAGTAPLRPGRLLELLGVGLLLALLGALALVASLGTV